MIQIDDKYKRNLVHFPLDLKEAYAAHEEPEGWDGIEISSITFTSEVTGTKVTLREPKFSRIDWDKDYISVVCDLSSLEDGEYVYSIDGDFSCTYYYIIRKALTGIIHIGTLEAEKVEYQANNTNIQYKTDF